MPAKLTVHPRGRVSRFVLVEEGETLSIGRDASCSFSLDDPCVSKRHALLVGDTFGWRIEDLGSKNGTTVNGTPVARGALKHGDRISLGGVEARFEILTVAQGVALASERLARAETTAAMRRRLSPDLPPAELLRRFLESALQVTGTERGFVLSIRSGGGWSVTAALGFSPDHLVDQRFRGSVGAVREVLASQAPLVVSDVSRDPYFSKRTSVVTLGIGALACVPLRFAGALGGLVYLDSRTRVPEFSGVDLEILEALADHTAAVLSSYPPERRPEEPPDGALAGQLQRRLGELLLAQDCA